MIYAKPGNVTDRGLWGAFFKEIQPVTDTLDRGWTGGNDPSEIRPFPPMDHSRQSRDRGCQSVNRRCQSRPMTDEQP